MPACASTCHTLYQFTDRWVVDDTQVPHRLRCPRHAPRRRPRRTPSSGSATAVVPTHHHPRRSTPMNTDHDPPTRRGRDGRAPPPSRSPASPPSARSSTTPRPRRTDGRDPRRLPPIRAPSRPGSSSSSSAPRCSPRRRPARPPRRRHEGRWIAVVGIAAATVQVIGLSRWVLLVPGVSDDAARAGPDAPTPSTPSNCCTLARQRARRDGRLRAHRDLHGARGPRASRRVDRCPLDDATRATSQPRLIATGVVIPLGLDAASLTNFAGYVLWCLWLIAMAVVLVRPGHELADTHSTALAPQG